MAGKRIVVGSLAASLALVAVLLFGYERLKQCEVRLDLAFKMTGPQRFEELSSAERRAVQEWARLNKITPSQALVGREVRALAIGDQTCVALLLERGALGGSPVYCFDRSGVLASRFDNAE